MGQQKRKRLLQLNPNLERIEDNTYPILGWNPNNSGVSVSYTHQDVYKRQTYAHACNKELIVTARDPAKGSHDAPDSNTPNNNTFAVFSVGHAANGNAKKSVKNGKAKPNEQPYLGVGNVKISFEGFNKQGEYLAVDKRRNVGKHKHRYYVPCVAEVGS